ncbi:hypothetical protein MSG28_016021 [Choristoneura fumiferana]|uniref:Uncharacterized protein n=1 Tax=Choristoneura fumiferana TaxID=7141 RepID=A0ACC0K573_CHOFU|nr:hypothetical protein MSG28_016021 [Choristoneura fumiferana]
MDTPSQKLHLIRPTLFFVWGIIDSKYKKQKVPPSPIVVWRMKAPEKKPLVRPEKPEEVRAKVRRGSQKKQPSPVHALAEFQSPAESV